MDTKTKILNVLEENKGESVSGSVIARSLGISRAAVWKAVDALRKDGHIIEAGSGRGYILKAESDKLTPEGIRQSLEPDIDVVLYDSIDSTNKEAKRLAISEPERPVLIAANCQTEGRGRLGRSFYSPADTGLYISFLFKPSFGISKATFTTAAAAVAVTKAVRTVTGLQCGIKWVNDVYLNDKKICGILTEGITGVETNSLDYMVVGIGINCHPADLAPIAGDRAGDLGGGLSRNELIAQVANELVPLLENLDPARFMDYYREHSIVIGEDILITRAGVASDQPGTRAKATGISDEGGLIVAYTDGRKETLTSGEITIRKYQ